MKWITIQLLRLQLNKVQKQRTEMLNNIILAKAYDDMIQSYKHTIMFLKAHK
jgi:hypothetical protein